MTELKVIHDLTELRDWGGALKQRGKDLAFVPTLGNLHAGHLSLVKYAQTLAPVTVVSIFVNPTQFAAGEDFAKYPRTMAADCELLAAQGCDAVYAPSVDTLYPHGVEGRTRVLAAPELTVSLCGDSRPGHFDGVVDVVSRLFNQVQPEIAVFGEKDFQQLQVIDRMSRDLGFAVRIEGAPIVREKNGLAMSSRNRYLSEEQRELAGGLYATLQWIAEQIHAGSDNYDDLLDAGRERLRTMGFVVDYLEIRDSVQLGPARAGAGPLRIFAAAFLGQTRLIDNLAV